MNLIEKLRAKQREFDRGYRIAVDDGYGYRSAYDIDSLDMSSLLKQAADTIEGQALLIEQNREPRKFWHGCGVE